MRLTTLTLVLLIPVGPAMAQEVIDLRPATPHSARVATPPSVDAGLANGDAKVSGAPSVGDGRANGVVKQAGAPSVGNGVANGIVKSTTVHQ